VSSDIDAILRSSLKDQYHATLEMLRRSIELCPDEAWADGRDAVPFWRVAYHALYYTHLYLQPDESSFTPWERHQTGLQDLDDVPGPPHLLEVLELPHRPPQTGVPYTRAEVSEYWGLCDGMVDGAIDAFDTLSVKSGFSWHDPSRPKVQHHIQSVRHIQHHASQLASRVREASGASVDWVGSGRTTTASAAIARKP
jgi:hypothetical protein